MQSDFGSKLSELATKTNTHSLVAFSVHIRPRKHLTQKKQRDLEGKINGRSALFGKQGQLMGWNSSNPGTNGTRESVNIMRCLYFYHYVHTPRAYTDTSKVHKFRTLRVRGVLRDEVHYSTSDAISSRPPICLCFSRPIRSLISGSTSSNVSRPVQAGVVMAMYLAGCCCRRVTTARVCEAGG